MSFMLDRIGRFLARYLEEPVQGYEPFTPSDFGALQATLQPGDVLLVEGNNHVSGIIKYLTQSTWSHAALFIGDGTLIEAELGLGVVRSPLGKYAGFHLRICRPVGLDQAALGRVIAFADARVGGRYDLRNALDLMRWLIPQPPVPRRWRRRMITLGSGEPTRAICSSLIAEAFNAVGYPILPDIGQLGGADAAEAREVLHVRHHSLYAPRDFDVSPYFAVVKPTLEHGFDYRCLPWADRTPPAHCPRCDRMVIALARA